jgi:undecaprenyl diphosphate synthase
MSQRAPLSARGVVSYTSLGKTSQSVAIPLEFTEKRWKLVNRGRCERGPGTNVGAVVAAHRQTSHALTAIPEGIDPNRIPVHIAAVMDGNGRWAQRRNLPRTDGHAAGEEALFDSVNGALALGTKWYTVYAFSTENWRRPVDEVRFLMNFNESILVRRRDELNDLGVRVRFIGRRNWRVPRRLIRQIEEAEALTAHNRRMTLSFAFNYGGRAELVDAIQRMIEDRVKSKDVDDKLVAKYLYAPDMPDPDLMIRTSGEFRTSNFLLWQLAYSELVFADVLWPDFRRQDLFDAVREYQSRARRFGAVEPHES